MLKTVAVDDWRSLLARPFMDRAQVIATLPHREPFLFVDAILLHEPKKRTVGYSRITRELDFFRGHFPQQAVLPGVLMIETLAQVGGVGVMVDYGARVLLLAGVDKARIRRKVEPDAELISDVCFLRVRGTLGRASCMLFADEHLVCEAEILFAVQG